MRRRVFLVIGGYEENVSVFNLSSITAEIILKLTDI